MESDGEAKFVCKSGEGANALVLLPAVFPVRVDKEDEEKSSGAGRLLAFFAVSVLALFAFAFGVVAEDGERGSRANAADLGDNNPPPSEPGRNSGDPGPPDTELEPERRPYEFALTIFSGAGADAAVFVPEPETIGFELRLGFELPGP